MSKRISREIERIDNLINSFQQHSLGWSEKRDTHPFGETIHRLLYERMLVATQIGKTKYGRRSNLRRSR